MAYATGDGKSICPGLDGVRFAPHQTPPIARAPWERVDRAEVVAVSEAVTVDVVVEVGVTVAVVVLAVTQLLGAGVPVSVSALVSVAESALVSVLLLVSASEPLSASGGWKLYHVGAVR